jgi:iron(III) transport system permease protein
MAVIGYWLWRGARVGEPLLPAGSLVVNSLQASTFGAIVTVAAAWPVALLSVRHPSRTSRIVERLSWSGHALPGIVVALALVFFGAQRLPWAYQTMGMLVFAYMILFLPQAVGAIRASLLQVTPSLEEASRLLGAGPAATFARIVLPLTRPGVVAAGALVFLTCMKELPATLLLSPTGFDTLATRVWTASSEAFLARAAAPALALVLFSSLPMAVLVLREAERRGQPAGKATADDPSIRTPTR